MNLSEDLVVVQRPCLEQPTEHGGGRLVVLIDLWSRLFPQLLLHLLTGELRHMLLSGDEAVELQGQPTRISDQV